MTRSPPLGGSGGEGSDVGGVVTPRRPPPLHDNRPFGSSDGGGGAESAWAAFGGEGGASPIMGRISPISFHMGEESGGAAAAVDTLEPEADTTLARPFDDDDDALERYSSEGE